MLPEGWKEGMVQDLVTGLESGVSVNGSDRKVLCGENAVLKISAVSYGAFDKNAHKVIEAEEQGRAKTNPKAGQIIISRSNTEELVGASAYIEDDCPNLFLPDKLWQTIPKDNSNMKWLSYVLASAKSRYTLSRLATGTSGSMKNITKGELLSLKILIPELPEQKKIAQILSTWDQAIEITKKLIENSIAQKKALMQQLLTGKKRLPGFSGEWQEYRLGQLFTERTENNRLDLRQLSITQNRGVIYRDDVGRKDTSSKDKSKYKRLCPNDIGYNTMRMWQGVSALSDKEGIVSPAYTIVTPGEKAQSLYMSYLFKLPKTIHDFYRHSQGLVSDTWNLKYPNFSKIKVTVPTYEEQEKIASILQTADMQTENLIRQQEKLQQEKKALMQQLLTGKRRVKV